MTPCYARACLGGVNMIRAMKSNRKTWIAGSAGVLLLIIALLYQFSHAFRNSVNSIGGNSSHQIDGTSTSHLHDRDKVVRTKDPRVELLGAGKMPPPSKESIEAFLKSCNRSEKALAVVYMLTENRDYLNEIRASAHTSIAYFMLGTFSTSAVERLQWSIKLAQADPGNAMANMTAARALSYSGNLEDALGYLSKANESSSFSNYFSSLAQTFSGGAAFFDGGTKYKAYHAFPSSANCYISASFTDLANKIKESGMRDESAAVVFQQLYSGLERMEAGTGTIYGEKANFDLDRLILLSKAKKVIKPDLLPPSLQLSQLPQNIIEDLVKKNQSEALHMQDITPEELDREVEDRLGRP